MRKVSVGDGYVMLIVAMMSWVDTCVKCIKLYPFNMDSLVYVNYTPRKQFSKYSFLCFFICFTQSSIYIYCFGMRETGINNWGAGSQTTVHTFGSLTGVDTVNVFLSCLGH